MTMEQVNEDINLTTLMEGELERAEIILAARDILQRIQKMTEDLAKINTEDVMPLVDNIKGIFGPEAGERFEDVASDSIKKSVDALRDTKDQINQQVLFMEGKISEPELTDMGSGNTGDEQTTDQPINQPSDEQDDPFGGSDAASGPENEPLGRAKKESATRGGNMIVEDTSGKHIVYSKRTLKITKQFDSYKDAKKYFDDEGLTRANYAIVSVDDVTDEELKQGKLNENSGELEKLVSWVLKESEGRMRPTQYLKFTQNLALHAARDPHGLTEWLTRKQQNLRESSDIVREYYEGEINTNIRKLQSDPKGYKLATQILSFIRDSGLTDKEKEAWTNVLSHFSAFHDDPKTWMDPEEKFEKAVRSVSLNPTGGDAEGKKISNGLKKLAYHFHMKHDMDESLHEQDLDEASTIYKISQNEAQKIWAEQDLAKKKALACSVIDNFIANKESKTFEKNKINTMNTTAKIDRWVANMALHGDGLGLGMGRQKSNIRDSIEDDDSNITEAKSKIVDDGKTKKVMTASGDTIERKHPSVETAALSAYKENDRKKFDKALKGIPANDRDDIWSKFDRKGKNLNKSDAVQIVKSYLKEENISELNLSPADAKNAKNALSKISINMNKPGGGNQTVDQATGVLTTAEKQAVSKVSTGIQKTTGKKPTNVKDLTTQGQLAVGESADDQVEENLLFATNIKTGDYGQHQGEPLSTDAGKFKAQTAFPGHSTSKTPSGKSGGKSGEVKPISDANANTVGKGKYGQNQGQSMSTDSGLNKANTNKATATSTAKPQPFKPNGPSANLHKKGVMGAGLKAETKESITIQYSRGNGPIRAKTFESIEEYNSWITEANKQGSYRLVE
jgi:hypothetical protein